MLVDFLPGITAVVPKAVSSAVDPSSTMTIYWKSHTEIVDRGKIISARERERWKINPFRSSLTPQKLAAQQRLEKARRDLAELKRKRSPDLCDPFTPNPLLCLPPQVLKRRIFGPAEPDDAVKRRDSMEFLAANEREKLRQQSIEDQNKRLENSHRSRVMEVFGDSVFGYSSWHNGSAQDELVVYQNGRAAASPTRSEVRLNKNVASEGKTKQKRGWVYDEVRERWDWNDTERNRPTRRLGRKSISSPLRQCSLAAEEE